MNELDSEESEELLRKFYAVILENHDLQVRFKWRNVGDIGMSILLFPSFFSLCFDLSWMIEDIPFIYIPQR